MNRLVSLIVILSIIYYFYYNERKVIKDYKNLLKPKISTELEKDKYNIVTKNVDVPVKNINDDYVVLDD